jgi:hypothetical protein
MQSAHFRDDKVGPPARKRRVAKTGPAAILKGMHPSECVDEVDLLPLERRFLGAR